MRGRYRQLSRDLYSSSFDNNPLAFSSQTICAWQIFKNNFVWQKNVLQIRERQKNWNQRTNQLTGRQAKNKIPILADKKTFFHFFTRDKFFAGDFFMVWEIVSDAARETEKIIFTFLFFSFWQTRKPLSPPGQKFYWRKMIKVLSLFFCSFFSAGQEKMLLSFLRFYFGWTKEISRTKILNISRFTVWEKGRFLTCRRRTNLEMPITSALANSWADVYFINFLFVIVL